MKLQSVLFQDLEPTGDRVSLDDVFAGDDLPCEPPLRESSIERQQMWQMPGLAAAQAPETHNRREMISQHTKG